MGLPLMVRGGPLVTAATAWFAVGLGALLRGTFAPPTVIGTPPTTGTSISVSGSRERLYPEAYLWGQREGPVELSSRELGVRRRRPVRDRVFKMQRAVLSVLTESK
jgi:hypothetical protein